MAKARNPWDIRPAKKTASVRTALKAEVEAKAKILIETVLKPKHISPPTEGELFNYISDITVKWYRNNFIFTSTYTCPDPKAFSPSFESKFARTEPLGDDTSPCISCATRAKNGSAFSMHFPWTSA